MGTDAKFQAAKCVCTSSAIPHACSESIAVDGVSFTARPGEIFGLLGPNGGRLTFLSARPNASAGCQSWHRTRESNVGLFLLKANYRAMNQLCDQKNVHNYDVYVNHGSSQHQQ
jgi:ABC-type phosphonate transport system ATPase subunit